MRTTKFRSRVLLVAVAVTLVFAAATIFAVHDDGLFELGTPPYGAGSGDIAGSATQSGPDWGDLFTSTGAFKDVIGVAGRPDYKDYGGVGADFVKDDVAAGGSPDSTIFNAGKMSDPVSAWTWKAGSVPAKDDIKNVYLYAVVNPVPDPNDGKNHLILYTGMERLAANGDAHLSIELNQQTILPKADHTFSGARTAGDLMISMDFSSGGTFGALAIYKWNGVGFNLLQNLGSEGCNTDDTVCAFNNGATITGVLGDTIVPNAFTEMGMDVTKLVPGGLLPCFSAVTFKTRSSNSLGSDLKDFAISSLKLCGIEVTKNCSDTLVGSPVNFTGSIKNIGAIPLTNISITDDQAGSSIAPLSTTTLQPGQSVSYTGSYPSPSSTGNTTDTVTATGHAYTPAGQSVTDTAQATCKVDVASISATKVCTAGKLGDPVSISGTITNTGTVALNGITITDDQPGSLIAPLSTTTLAAGASVNYTGSYIPDPIPGSTSDTVHVTGHKADSSPVEAFGSATCTVTGPPAISKSFTDSVIPQFGTTTLSFTITNPNAVPLSGVGFSDTLPSGLVIDNPVVLNGSCGGGSISTGTDSISLSGATLGPLGSCTFSVKVAGTTTGVKNNLTGKVTSTQGGDGNQAFASLSVEQGNVIIHKTSNATSSTTLGSTITYSYDVKNTGSSTITSFTVTDTKLGSITCPVSSLAPGASTTCTATYVVQQSDMDAGSIYNKVTVNGVTSVGSVSASDDLTIPLTQTKGLTLAKSASPSTYSSVGTVITYTYTITNSGNVTLAGPFSVSDNKLGTISPCGSGPLAPASATSCTATHTITQDDLDAGSITNVATASGNDVTSAPSSVTVTAAQTKALTLAKTASPATYSSVGTVITYTYKVTNSSNVTLAGPFSVSDDKLGSIACGSGPLAPGASTSCTATHTITQADIDSGSITNTATASGNGVTSPSATATVTATQTKGLSLAKSASPATYSSVGTVTTYTYTITNSGNVTLAGPFSVSDDKLGSINPCGSGPLGAGATTSCTATHTITQADLDAGSITNTATASGNSVTSPSATATVTATQTKGLSLAKSASPATYSSVGTVITYTYTITNSGNVTLAGPFSISDDKLGSINPCGSGPLAPGATTTCTATHTITQADIDAGSITNTATSSGNGATSPSATATVTANQTKALTLAKSASPSTYSSAGTVITYTYKITNSGNVTLAGPFSVSDDKLGSIDPCGTGPLAPGASTSCTATHTITQADLDAGSITNTATSSGNGVTSPSATATVTAIQTKGLTLAKSASPSTYSSAGTVITYTYKITNSGNVTLAGPFSVTDDKLGSINPCGSGPLAPGASTNCTATHTITQADLDAGSITNTATSSGNGVTSPSATATVTANQTKGLTLAKSASPSTYSSTGTVITYTYKITNSGNVTLGGPFSVSDDKLGSISPCGTGPLAPGASTSCTATHTTTQADLDAGSITNIATSSGNGVTSPSATATVTGTQAKGLTLAKSASPSTYSSTGTVITYTYTITNSGNVGLAGPFSVTDNKLGTISPCGTGPLAPGASTSCTATHTITQADLDAGSITNIATSSGNGVTSPSATATVTATQTKGLTLAKSASPSTYSNTGTVITYTYTITNSSNVTLAGPFSVSDDKLGSISPCGSGPLAPGASTGCTAAHIITQADLDAGSITNTATASGNGATSLPVSATVTAVQTKLLTLVKTGAGSFSNPPKPGDTIHYTFSITNTGNVTLTGGQLTDALVGYNNVACGAATLSVAASTSCSASYTITQANIDSGSVTNTATACATPPSGGAVCSTAGIVVPIPQLPHLSLTKSASPASFSAAGQIINYTLAAKNDGNLTLYNVSISDPKLPTLVCSPSQPATLSVGQSLTCTGSYTTTTTDLAAGKVVNTAAATGLGPQNQPVSATASRTVTGYKSSGSGVLAPTGTTCQQFASGTASPLEPLQYTLKNGQINSLSPGVFFYYYDFGTPVANSTSVTYSEVNTPLVAGNPWPDIPVQKDQVFAYDSNCVRLKDVTVNSTSTFTVGPNTRYISIKYEASSLKGTPIPPAATTTLYTFTVQGTPATTVAQPK